MKNKLTSRKFWLAVASFLGSVGVGITGLIIGDSDLTTVGTVCCVVSAAIYQFIEAMVDLEK